MTKQEAIAEAIKRLDATGETQFIDRRGDEYAINYSHGISPRGWKCAEMIKQTNVHAYRTAAQS